MKVCRRTGKIGYRSVGEARAASKDIGVTRHFLTGYVPDKRESGAYRCLYCPRWHLTSQWQTSANGVNFDD